MSWILPREWIEGSPILSISLDEIQRLALSFGISPSSKIGKMKDMPFILLTLDEEQTPKGIPWISCREIEEIRLPSIHSLGKIQDIEKSKHLSISPDDIQGKMKEMSFVWPILDEGLIPKERANLWISSKEMKRMGLPSIHSLGEIQDIEKLKHLSISPDDFPR